MAEPFNIWEGIYASFESASVDAIGAGFEGEVYNERAYNAAKDCLTALESGKPIPSFHKQRSNLLPPVVAMMLAKSKTIQVLDFGGGLGIGYMTLAESIPDCSQAVEYNVVEFPDICEKGRNLHSGKINFLQDLPGQGHFDLVHSSSALQYIEDWKGLLRKFVEFTPEYILLSDVFAGNIPTFVTLQKYYDSRIKHWFFNIGEFGSFFSQIGYELIMQSYVNSKRLQADDDLPMGNFPDSHRIQQTLHLLLRRK